MPISADRAAEMNRLLVTQGHATRSMKAGWQPNDEDKIRIKERGDRLIELAELLGHEHPATYVNDRIAAWLQMNPLALSTQRVTKLLESKQQSDCGVSSGVVISIGDLTKGGYYYTVMDDDLSWPHQLEIKVPESVAEHFRQQGRRQLQREFASMMALETRY